MRFYIKGATIRARDGGEHVFPHPVAEILDFPEVSVVRLEVPTGTIFNRNVFGVSPDGTVLWQIEEFTVHEGQSSPYTGINREGDRVSAYNWAGVLFEIDVETGKVLKRSFTK